MIMDYCMCYVAHAVLWSLGEQNDVHCYVRPQHIFYVW